MSQNTPFFTEVCFATQCFHCTFANMLYSVDLCMIMHFTHLVIVTVTSSSLNSWQNQIQLKNLHGPCLSPFILRNLWRFNHKMDSFLSSRSAASQFSIKILWWQVMGWGGIPGRHSSQQAQPVSPGSGSRVLIKVSDAAVTDRIGRVRCAVVYLTWTFLSLEAT